jgi:kynurenine 3-monooxygenase
MRPQALNIVGAGLAGALLAILLARRGFTVRIYERRDDPRRAAAEAGRSINLALAARGIQALEQAAIMERVRPLMIPMRGRMLHERGESASLLPYGQRDDEVIYSVGRAALNRVLIEEAARLPGVTFHFGQSCSQVDPARDVLTLADRLSGETLAVPLAPTIATDGAGSAVRASLAAGGYLSVREEPLEHDYKELSMPPDRGGFALAPHALHVWPRRGFMLIALPNTDRSFTVTLFLPRTGPISFDALRSEADVNGFFAAEFSDVVPLIPHLAMEFRDHPQGRLGTVHTAPWHVGAGVLLLGDAAHAIVPFHGQGMNAAFEDCRVLDAMLDGYEDWERLFAAFEHTRRPSAEAIARMAIENYGEMRESVLEAAFLEQKALALELERRFPGRFIPRYSMVMFHPEIPYSEALRRGVVQQEILERLTAAGGPIDFDLASSLIAERLSPVARSAQGDV